MIRGVDTSLTPERKTKYSKVSFYSNLSVHGPGIQPVFVLWEKDEEQSKNTLYYNQDVFITI